MSTLTIQIEIDDEPFEGYQDSKLESEFGETDGDSLGRIAKANAETFPRYKIDPKTIVLKAVAAAVAAAEE